MKNISELIKKAEKGDILANYGLYLYYTDDKYIKPDQDKAKIYLNNLIVNLKKQKIRISQIDILNFRAIQTLTIQFKNTNTNILVGINGAGKSSILDTIAYSLSWLINRILYRGGKGKEIDIIDINNSTNNYCSLITKVDINKKNSFKIVQCRTPKGSDYIKKSDYTDFTTLGKLYKLCCEYDDKFELPLFAYYGVKRSSDIQPQDLSSLDDLDILSNNRFDGYDDSLNGKADIKSFFRWYKRLDDLSKNEVIADNTPLSNAKFFNELEILAQKEQSAKELLNRLKSQKTNDNKPVTSRFNQTNSIINQVISNFMDGYTDLKVELKPAIHLSIKKNNQRLNILQLSQGEKSLLALILDITRRLMVLNPNSDTPLNCQGIILIDEIDLHLHPTWQRNIVKNLEKTFPNCQFIVSTHSPQIIGEIKAQQVLILDKNNENEIICTHPNQSYGLTSNQILDEIMSPDGKLLNRPIEIQEKINKIYDLISEKKLDNAKTEIESLKKELNGDIPELLNAQFDIDLNDWD